MAFLRKVVAPPDRLERPGAAGRAASHPLLRLQRRAGNRAVLAALRLQRQDAPPEGTGGAEAGEIRSPANAEVGAEFVDPAGRVWTRTTTGWKHVDADGNALVVAGDLVFAKEAAAEEKWLSQRAISFASRGKEVAECQELLNKHGATPPLAVDGQFGFGTLAAVKAFQLQAGLTADGLVGPKTWAALGGTSERRTISEQQAPQVPATGGV